MAVDLRSDPAACSTNTTVMPTQHAGQEQSVRLSANQTRPPRRSNDGQAILKAIQLGLETCSDLVFRVELWGFEPQTSCMPSERMQVQSLGGVRAGPAAAGILGSGLDVRQRESTGRDHVTHERQSRQQAPRAPRARFASPRSRHSLRAVAAVYGGAGSVRVQPRRKRHDRGYRACRPETAGAAQCRPGTSTPTVK